MRLRTKVLLIVGALLTTYALGSYLLQRSIVLEAFAKLERDAALRDLTRARETFRHEVETLLTSTTDWGNWADVYDYMSSRDEGFIRENFSSSGVTGLKIDYAALLAVDGTVIWSSTYTPEGEMRPIPRELSGARPPVFQPWAASVPNGLRSAGLVATEHGVLALAGGPILNGQGKGPVRGAVLMGRFVTPEFVQRVAQQAQIDLRVEPTQPDDAAMDAIFPRVQEQQDRLLATDLLADLSGSPILKLDVRLGRDILAQGRSTVALTASSFVFAALLVLALLFYVLQTLVLRRLSEIVRHVLRVARSDDLTLRLNMAGHDEIAVVAREIDSMVLKLRDTRRRLLERSYEAGAAELARGTLHNFGNALTPMTVQAARAEDSLNGAPVEDLRRAAEELAAGGPGGERAAALREFLVLAAADAAAARDDARARVRELQDSLEGLQALLRFESTGTRQQPFVDRATVVELIEDSVRLCPPTRIEWIRLSISEGLRALPYTSLPIMLLKQVFQNLIINAAESGGGKREVALSIDGRVLLGSDGSMLELTFADDGEGIAEDALPRLFEKGFSTKPSASNSGIGLHWCANALGSIGGSIRAESDGPGRGARFILRIPFESASGANAPEELAA